MVSDRVLRRLIRSDYAVALLGDLIRMVLGGSIVLLIAAWIAYYSAIVPFMFTRLHMNDFGKFYYSTRSYLDGQGMYAPNPATAIPVGPSEARQFWNMNPPHFHLLVLPLAKLSELPAFALWAAVNFAALGLTLVLIWRELALRWTTSHITWAIFAGVAWSATGATIVTGQPAFLLTLGVTIAWCASRRGHWTKAGIWLGVLASIKPFLGVFWLYFVVSRRSKPALAMTGAGLACLATGLAIFGWTPYFDWLAALRSVTWTWAPMNASFVGLVARTLEASPLFKAAYQMPTLIPWLSWLGASAIALMTFRQILRVDDNSRMDRTFLSLLLMAQLVTPLGWVYYSWIAVGPLVAWWPTRAHTLTTTLLVALAVPGFLCPVPLTAAWSSQSWAAFTIGSVYFWMVAALWCAVMYRPRDLHRRRMR